MGCQSIRQTNNTISRPAMGKMWLVLVAMVALSFDVCEGQYYEASAVWAPDTVGVDTTTTTDNVTGAETETLLTAAQDLHRVFRNKHSATIAKHAALLQDWKPKAYAHKLKASTAAIRAALKAMSAQLSAGHKHDSAALAATKKFTLKAIGKAIARGEQKTTNIKHKACPALQRYKVTKARLNAVEKAMNQIGEGKICASRVEATLTFGKMEVDKNEPTLGVELRKQWEKTKASYARVAAKHAIAQKAFRLAKKAFDDEMASFRVALRLEASGAHTACQNAHREYTALVNDIEKNVATRKQVYRAHLVVTRYIDNLQANAASKSCAARARRADTSRFNLSREALQPCRSKVTLRARFGPENWQPRHRQCEVHRQEKATKAEKVAKERARKEKVKKEKSTKENAKKEKIRKEKSKKESKAKEKVEKEKVAKEKTAKVKVEKDAKAKKERKEKADEKVSKEKTKKEKTNKEVDKKAKAKEKATKVKEKAVKEKAAKKKEEEAAKGKEKAGKVESEEGESEEREEYEGECEERKD